MLMTSNLKISPTMMKVIKSIAEMQRTAEELRLSGQRIALVPTMGFLHEGHLSLFRLAHEKADIVAVSIFVNPTQFGPNEDFDLYPRNFEHDQQLCRQENADIIFFPTPEEMYNQSYLTYVSTENLAAKLCGHSRPNHFRGVTTVVSKLFNIVKPHVAVFGQKDAQQALILRRMVIDLNFDIQLIIAPIVREKDGLAISSRNKYLTEPERAQAVILNQALRHGENLIRQNVRAAKTIYNEMKDLIDQATLVRLDYLEIVDYETLQPITTVGNGTLIAVAAFLGKTRLIDNVLITDPEDGTE
jgi:pantoate--beta-alanine ligase